MSAESNRNEKIKALMRSTRRMIGGYERSNNRLDQGETPFCNFCGKEQHEVGRLLAGADAYICDDCVALASEVIKEGQ